MKLKAVVVGTMTLKDRHNSLHVEVIEKGEEVVQSIRKAGLACSNKIRLQLRVGDSLL